MDLLVESLTAWGVAATIGRDGDGNLVLHAGQLALSIRRAPSDLPFRWLVCSDGRSRGASGVVGLLRLVRAAVDPAHRPIRVKIAALTRVP
jgi:hypothetical protein